MRNLLLGLLLLAFSGMAFAQVRVCTSGCAPGPKKSSSISVGNKKLIPLTIVKPTVKIERTVSTRPSLAPTRALVKPTTTTVEPPKFHESFEAKVKSQKVYPEIMARVNRGDYKAYFQSLGGPKYFAPSYYSSLFAVEAKGDCMVNDLGCAQIKSFTAQRLGIRPEQRYIPKYAFKAAKKYLIYQSTVGGFPLKTDQQRLLAFFGYNRGEGHMLDGIKLAKKCGFKNADINTVLFNAPPRVIVKSPKKELERQSACNALMEYRNSEYTQSGINHISKIARVQRSLAKNDPLYNK